MPRSALQHAVIYARTLPKSDSARVHLSRERQIELLRSHAGANQFRVVAEYHDGPDAVGQPELAKACAHFGHRWGGAVIALDIVRLGGAQDAACWWRVLQDKRRRLVIVNDDPAPSPEWSRILARYAQIARQVRTHRIGWESEPTEPSDSVDVDFDEVYAEIIRMRIEQGMTYPAIAHELNELGFVTEKGLPFTADNARRIVNQRAG